MNRRIVLKSIFFTSAAIVSPAFASKPAKAATVHKVEISGFRFKPKKLSVAVGDTIEFTNSDGTPHTATASDFSWKTSSLGRGDKQKIEVVAGMKTNYFCEFHPQMKAKLVIES